MIDEYFLRSFIVARMTMSLVVNFVRVAEEEMVRGQFPVKSKVNLQTRLNSNSMWWSVICSRYATELQSFHKHTFSVQGKECG